MKTLRNVSLVLVGALALSACAKNIPEHGPGVPSSRSPDAMLSSAKKMSPTGSAFNQSLYKNYLAFAVFEKKQNDRPATSAFAHRALVSGSGKSILPEAISKRRLPAANVGELTQARTRLIAALDAGGRDNQPDLAGLAQVKFDCWMEQQEENTQPDHINACKLEFMDIIPKLESKPAPLAAIPGPYIVYFDFDSFDLTAEALAVIKEASAAAKAAKTKGAILNGHTDRAGALDYNKGLSRARVVAVGNQLFVDGGATRKNITKNYYGEVQPSVQTDDGVREGKNRRVTITLKR